jgi:hypothetical protein
LAIWGCQGIPLILAYIILANSDPIIIKYNIHNKFSDFYFGEFLKITKIGQNYIPAKKTGYTVIWAYHVPFGDALFLEVFKHFSKKRHVVEL